MLERNLLCQAGRFVALCCCAAVLLCSREPALLSGKESYLCCFLSHSRTSRYNMCAFLFFMPRFFLGERCFPPLFGPFREEEANEKVAVRDGTEGRMPLPLQGKRINSRTFDMSVLHG